MLVEGAHGGISSSYLATLYITVLKSSCLLFLYVLFVVTLVCFVYSCVCVCFDMLLVFHTRTIRKRYCQTLYADTNTEGIKFLISKKR